MGKWYLSKAIINKLCELEIIYISNSRNSDIAKQSFENNVSNNQSLNKGLIQLYQHRKNDSISSKQQNDDIIWSIV